MKVLKLNEKGETGCCPRFNPEPWDEKEIRWVGSAYDDLLTFPDEPRRSAGFQLGKVQVGLDPDNWKPMSTIGRGVRELRVRDTTGAYRVIYVASLAEAVFVLHAFQKKTQRTSPGDLALAQSRFRELKARAKR